MADESVRMPLADVKAIEFEDRLLLVSQRRQILLILNETARIVWQAMRAGVSADEVAALLSQSYGIPLPRARVDVAALLRQWRVPELPEEDSHRQSASRRRPSGPGMATGTVVHRDFGPQRVYDPCGTAVRLSIESPDLRAWFDQLLGHTEKPDAAPRDAVEVFSEGAEHVVTYREIERHRSPSIESAAGAVVRAICDLSYPDADWSMFMHAAAVATCDHAVVLAGPNGSGKSTLTAALIRCGYDYFSDDVVPFDGRTSRILPVPFALSIKEGSWPALSALYPVLASLPAYKAGGQMRRFLPPPERAIRRADAAVRALVFPRFRPGQRFALERLTAVDTLLKLVNASRPLALDRPRLDRTLAWVRTVPAYDLTYPDLAEATAAVRELSAV